MIWLVLFTRQYSTYLTQLCTKNIIDNTELLLRWKLNIVNLTSARLMSASGASRKGFGVVSCDVQPAPLYPSQPCDALRSNSTAIQSPGSAVGTKLIGCWLRKRMTQQLWLRSHYPRGQSVLTALIKFGVPNICCSLFTELVLM